MKCPFFRQDKFRCNSDVTIWNGHKNSFASGISRYELSWNNATRIRNSAQIFSVLRNSDGPPSPTWRWPPGCRGPGPRAGTRYGPIPPGVRGGPVGARGVGGPVRAPGVGGPVQALDVVCRVDDQDAWGQPRSEVGASYQGQKDPGITVNIFSFNPTQIVIFSSAKFILHFSAECSNCKVYTTKQIYFSVIR